MINDDEFDWFLIGMQIALENTGMSFNKKKCRRKGTDNTNI